MRGSCLSPSCSLPFSCALFSSPGRFPNNKQVRYLHFCAVPPLGASNGRAFSRRKHVTGTVLLKEKQHKQPVDKTKGLFTNSQPPSKNNLVWVLSFEHYILLKSRDKIHSLGTEPGPNTWQASIMADRPWMPCALCHRIDYENYKRAPGCEGQWSRGMTLALGARGREFGFP